MRKISIDKSVKGLYIADSGLNLYLDLRNSLNKGENCEVSFLGFDAMSSSFYNASIGNLIDDFGLDFVRQKVKFINVSKSLGSWLKKYIEDQASLCKG